ncbi:MAG: hypothetical protein ACTSYE_03460 [Alphaproteobacteria bacterium]
METFVSVVARALSGRLRAGWGRGICWTSWRKNNLVELTFVNACAAERPNFNIALQHVVGRGAPRRSRMVPAAAALGRGVAGL